MSAEEKIESGNAKARERQAQDKTKRKTGTLKGMKSIAILSRDHSLPITDSTLMVTAGKEA